MSGFLPERDSAGRVFYRNTVTESGWAYLALFVDFKINTLNGVRCKNHLGQDYATTVKFFDAEYGGNELVAGTQAELDSSSKRMEVTADIGFVFDLIQGQIQSRDYAPNDMYLDVANGLASLGDAYTKAFVENCNLYHSNNIETNGRAGKRMETENPLVPGVPANVFKFIFRSPTAGQKHAMQAGVEFYRDIS